MSSIESLLFYLFSFSCAALLMYYGTKRNHKLIVGISLLIPIIIGGLRYNVGTDYPTYVAVYDQLSQLSLAQYLSLPSLDIEIGFYFLIKLSNLIMGNYIPLLLFSSFLTVFFFYLGLKRYNTKHTALVYFLFLTVVFPFSLNGIRQGIAISLCFLAFSFIIEHKPKKYILWIVVASLFHKSALFLLPFYFINKLIKNGSHNFVLMKSLLLASIIYFLLPYTYELLQTTSFFSRYSAYQSITADGNNNIFYLKVVILIVILLFYKRIISHDKKNIYFLIFIVLDVVLSTLGFGSPFVKRIALYFSLFSPLLLASIPDIFSDKFGKFICYSTLVAYGLLYFYLAFYLMGQSDIFPYQFIPWGNL